MRPACVCRVPVKPYGSHPSVDELWMQSGEPGQSHGSSSPSQPGNTPHKPIYEPRSEKTGLRGFRPGPTQSGLYNQRRQLEA